MFWRSEWEVRTMLKYHNCIHESLNQRELPLLMSSRGIKSACTRSASLVVRHNVLHFDEFAFWTDNNNSIMKTVTSAIHLSALRALVCYVRIWWLKRTEEIIELLKERRPIHPCCLLAREARNFCFLKVVIARFWTKNTSNEYDAAINRCEHCWN